MGDEQLEWLQDWQSVVCERMKPCTRLPDGLGPQMSAAEPVLWRRRGAQVQFVRGLRLDATSPQWHAKASRGQVRTAPPTSSTARGTAHDRRPPRRTPHLLLAHPATRCVQSRRWRPLGIPAEARPARHRRDRRLDGAAPSRDRESTPSTRPLRNYLDPRHTTRSSAASVL
jgi:hypothetical protein